MLHIRDVDGPKKTGSADTRLEAMEQQVFKCQGMVERGHNANHMMITEFTNKHMIDASDIGKHLCRLYDRIDQLQAQIYDLQNQNCDSDDMHAELDKNEEVIDDLVKLAEKSNTSLDKAIDFVVKLTDEKAKLHNEHDKQTEMSTASKKLHEKKSASRGGG
ncbi:40S ribosomal protein S5-1 [Hordeum vulgare]|nr:40S ribosomal protein S5-1 [Hordeum vulgare]